MQLHNKKLLLVRWIAGYGETLKPVLHIGNFKLPTKHPFLEHENFPVKMGNTIWVMSQLPRY